MIWTREDVERVAKDMYEDGTKYSERYSERAWKQRGWPIIDDVKVHVAIDGYLKYLRSMDEYEGNPVPEYRTGFGGGILRGDREPR
jgi:hypothetical protein